MMNRVIIKDTDGAILAVLYVPMGEVIIEERNGVTIGHDLQDKFIVEPFKEQP